MANNLLDSPIPEGCFFRNAPKCRTQREASNLYVQNGHWEEPHPPVDESAPVLHRIEEPFATKAITDRLVIQKDDNTVQKSVRIGGSDLAAEKRRLDLLGEKTTVPVPRVQAYFQTKEFEHLIMDKIKGVTLAEAWPDLSIKEREAIADQVVGYVQQMRTLESPIMDATQILRKPFSSGLKDSEEMSMRESKCFHKSLKSSLTYEREASCSVASQMYSLTGIWTGATSSSRRSRSRPSLTWKWGVSSRLIGNGCRLRDGHSTAPMRSPGLVFWSGVWPRRSGQSGTECGRLSSSSQL